MDGKVMQYMITRAALLLRAYPTTLEQDQATLKETKVKIILIRVASLQIKLFEAVL